MTRDVVINKKNELEITLDCEQHILYELQNAFSFDVEGASFSPAYRKKYWDGKIRLFKYASGEIYYGLLPYIRKFCEDNNIKIVSKIKEKAKPLDKLECARFCKALKIPKIEIRDYQREAFKYSVEKDRCLLVSPTASGKSLIIYLMLIYNLLRLKDTKEDKILVIVPTTSLVEQLYKVKVEKLNVLRTKSKPKVFKGVRGMRNETKRITVTLKQGNTIDLGASVK